MPLCHTRIKTFGEFMELCHFFFINHLDYSQELLTPKEISPEQAASLLQMLIWSLESREEWGGQALADASHEVSTLLEMNHKKVTMPLLFASLTGKRQGPPLFDSAQILGKERTRARLLNAINFLGGLSQKKIAHLKATWEKRGSQSQPTHSQKAQE